MNLPRSVLLPLLGYEIHVTEWGSRSNPAVILWHGLARTGRDFDELAKSLSEDYFVVCPDTIGRGLSSWATDPGAEYCLKNYGNIAIALLDHCSINSARWLGTSMGGLIGMYLASGQNAERISTLVINDIGPEIPQQAIDRILSYADELPIFSTIAAADEWLRATYKPFGPADEAFWHRMVINSIRRTDSGEITLHYDPNITNQFSEHPEDFKIWDLYNNIQQPTHLIWGAQSDVLTKPIVDQMLSSGPRPETSIFNDCGHAPNLSRPKDTALVKQLFE